MTTVALCRPRNQREPRLPLTIDFDLLWAVGSSEEGATIKVFSWHLTVVQP